jgi:hypothetical protein
MRAWTVAREAAFFDVEEREEAVAAQKRSGSGGAKEQVLWGFMQTCTVLFGHGVPG